MKYDTYENYMEKVMDDCSDRREIEQKTFERERERDYERKMERSRVLCQKLKIRRVKKC